MIYMVACISLVYTSTINSSALLIYWDTRSKVMFVLMPHCTYIALIYSSFSVVLRIGRKLRVFSGFFGFWILDFRL